MKIKYLAPIISKIILNVKPFENRFQKHQGFYVVFLYSVQSTVSAFVIFYSEICLRRKGRVSRDFVFALEAYFVATLASILVHL